MTLEVTAEEIAAINAARDALYAIKQRAAWDASRNETRVIVHAEVAGDALFSFVNNADTCLGLDLDEEALHRTSVRLAS